MSTAQEAGSVDRSILRRFCGGEVLLVAYLCFRQINDAGGRGAFLHVSAGVGVGPWDMAICLYCRQAAATPDEAIRMLYVRLYATQPGAATVTE